MNKLYFTDCDKDCFVPLGTYGNKIEMYDYIDELSYLTRKAPQEYSHWSRQKLQNEIDDKGIGIKKALSKLIVEDKKVLGLGD